jgi:hypothetical protein
VEKLFAVQIVQAQGHLDEDTHYSLIRKNEFLLGANFEKTLQIPLLAKLHHNENLKMNEIKKKKYGKKLDKKKNK